MKVFISWSGETSLQIAAELRKWIPLVLQNAKPYYSPEDIAKGTRWYGDIAASLELTKVGLVCLTPENVNSPWIMFEAGALAKDIQRSRVVPLLFGLEPTQVQGPLSHFQAAKFTKDDMKRVMDMMNTELGEAGLEKSSLSTAFEKWWPDLVAPITPLLTKPLPSPQPEKRGERDLLVEILELVRGMTLPRTAVLESGSFTPGVVLNSPEGILYLKRLCNAFQFACETVAQRVGDDVFAEIQLKLTSMAGFLRDFIDSLHLPPHISQTLTQAVEIGMSVLNVRRELRPASA